MMKINQRWSVVVSMYKRNSYKCYDNCLIQGIVVAESEVDSFKKNFSSISITDKIADGWIVNMKSSLPITEYNSETDNYEYPTQSLNKNAIMTALQHSLKQQALRLAGMKKFLQSQENTERQGEISNRIAIVEIQQEELQKFLDI